MVKENKLKIKSDKSANKLKRKEAKKEAGFKKIDKRIERDNMKRNMDLFRNQIFVGTLLSGWNGRPRGAYVFVETKIRYMRIGFTRYEKEEDVKFPYHELKDITLRKKENIIEKKKSPIARGVIGGALFGDIGIVLGVMSANEEEKTKRIVIRRDYLTIQYLTESQQDKVNINMAGGDCMRIIGNIQNIMNDRREDIQKKR